MKMTRATFIRISILAAFVVLFGAYIFRFRITVKAMLAKATADLFFKEGNVIGRFMDDADKEDYWRQFTYKKRLFICVQHFFHSFGIHLPLHSKYLQYRNKITAQFFMSTDFCSNQMDPLVYISYTSFYNQYRQPCSNPFSSNFYSGKV